MGDMEFNGTPEEWDALVKKNKEQETLEEVLGSSMCQFSVIENKLAILYRNQIKIYDAVTKEQQGYSEEEVLNFTQTMLMQYKFGNTNIEQMELLRETFQLFKNK